MQSDLKIQHERDLMEFKTIIVQLEEENYKLKKIIKYKD